MKNFTLDLQNQKLNLVTGETCNSINNSIYGYSDSELEEIRQMIELKNEKNLTNYVIIPTYECNFNCSYCFEEKINSNMSITSEDIKNMFSLMKDPLETSEITIMGGEPLLLKNMHLIEEIITTSKNKGYQYSIVTNGFELDSYLKILNTYKPKSIQVTIDGFKDIHDVRRRHKTLYNTYDKIIKNIEIFLKQDYQITVRINVDERNIESLPQLSKEFKEKFSKYKNFSSYLYLISDGGCTGDKYCMNEVGGLKKIIELLKSNPSMDIFKWSFHGFSFINSVLNNEFPKIKSIFCSACAGKQIIFAPNNKLYNCWFGVGNEKFSYGSYGNSLTIDEKQHKKWKSRTIFNLDKCKECKFKFVCGGGCANKSMKYYNDINEVHCPDYENIFKECFNFLRDRRE